MRIHSLLIAVIGSLSCGPAFADLKAQDVWQSIQTELSRNGEVKATVTKTDTGLTVSDLQRITQNGFGHHLTSKLQLKNQPDGTVAIIVPDLITFEPTQPEGASTLTSFKLENLSLVASGTTENIRYDLSGRSLNIISVTVQDNSVATIVTELSNVNGFLKLRTQGYRFLDGGLTIGFLKQNAASDQATNDLTVNDVALDLSVKMPKSANWQNLPPMLNNPQTYLRATLSHGLLGNFDKTLAKNGLPKGQSSFKQGSHLLDFSNGRVRLDTNFEGGTGYLNLGPGSPSYALGIDRMQIGWDAQVTRIHKVNTSTAKLSLSGVTIPDVLWSQFDPVGVLPQAPGDLTVSLGATGKFTILDLIAASPDARKLAMSKLFDTVEIKQLTLEALGTLLTANGQFKLDYPVLFEPPKYEGTLEATLTGGFALLEAFKALGTIPAQQINIIRGLSIAFATQTAGQDKLTTRLVFDRDGGLTANGQRLR